jgi:hypothetical protein
VATAHQQRQRRHQRLELDVGLAAEPATEQRHLHPHPVLRPAEQPGDLQPHEGRHLAGGVQGDAAVAGLTHGHERLQRHMQGGGAAEAMLEDPIRRPEPRLGVAPAQLEIERHIGAGAAG